MMGKQLPWRPNSKKKREMADRRHKVFDLLLQGINRHEIADRLNVSLMTINNDIAFIRRKNAENVTIEYDQSVFLSMSMKAFQRVIRQAWQDYDEAKTSAKGSFSARARYLDIIRNTQKDMLKTLQSVGILSRVSDAVTVQLPEKPGNTISIHPDIQKIVVQAVLNQAAGNKDIEPVLNPIALANNPPKNGTQAHDATDARG